MPSLLVRTKAAVSDCESHLAETESNGSPIESYLTQHVAVILCADIQQDVIRIVSDHTATLNSNVAKQFIQSALGKVFRSVKKSEIAGLLGQFDSAVKEHFNANISDQISTKYDNAVQIRHDVAHRHGSNITIRELRESIEAAEEILNAFSAALASVDGENAENQPQE